MNWIYKILVGIGIFIFGFMVSALYDSLTRSDYNPSDFVVAAGTLFLALATAISIWVNNIQYSTNRKASLESELRYRQAESEKEERYRKDQRDREERERKEYRLKEIIDWAIGATNGKFEDELKDIIITINRAEQTHSINSNKRKELMSKAFGKSAYIRIVSAQLDNGLKTSVDILESELWTFADNTIRHSRDSEEVQDDLRAHMYINIYEAANTVITRATELLKA